MRLQLPSMACLLRTSRVRQLPRMARCGRACISLETTASHVTSSSHCVTPQPSSDTATCKERKARVCGQRRAPQWQSPLRRHRCRSAGRAASFKDLRRLFCVAAAHSSFLRPCHFPTVTLSGSPPCFGSAFAAFTMNSTLCLRGVDVPRDVWSGMTEPDKLGFLIDQFHEFHGKHTGGLSISRKHP